MGAELLQLLLLFQGEHWLIDVTLGLPLTFQPLWVETPLAAVGTVFIGIKIGRVEHHRKVVASALAVSVTDALPPFLQPRGYSPVVEGDDKDA